MGRAMTIAVVLVLGGCATIFKGGTQVITFDSNVEGAKIYIDGQYRGDTPLQVDLDSNVRSYQVKATKEGYSEGSFTLRSNVGVGWIILDIVGGLVPAIVDAATGNWMELQPTYVDLTLEKL